jgi:hypothetical protein
VVHIQVEDELGGTRHGCSGVVISPAFILAANHCVTGATCGGPPTYSGLGRAWIFARLVPGGTEGGDPGAPPSPGFGPDYTHNALRPSGGAFNVTTPSGSIALRIHQAVDTQCIPGNEGASTQDISIIQLDQRIPMTAAGAAFLNAANMAANTASPPGSLQLPTLLVPITPVHPATIDPSQCSATRARRYGS